MGGTKAGGGGGSRGEETNHARSIIEGSPSIISFIYGLTHPLLIDVLYQGGEVVANIS